MDYCPSCVESQESELPHFLNRFLMVKNKDITLPMAETHLQKITQATDILPDECSVCHVTMEKTLDCNALEHCKTEMCYVCGRKAPANEKLENSHWLRCPRFFETEELKKKLKYCCVAGQCFHDHLPCKTQYHQQGIKNLFEYRKDRHAGAFLESLPRSIREEILLKNKKK